MAMIRALAVVALAGTLAACGSVGAIDLPWKKNRAPAAPDPTALPPLEATDLPPAGTEVAALPPYDEPLPQPGAATADAAPPPAAGLGRTDLLGGWTITSGADSCQLFMTLTSWTGGYRATTRGCNSDLLKSISAWNLNGTQIVLASQGGTPVAHLRSAGTNRFDGTGDAQGAAVSFYR
jgi:hypothetical protein